MTVKQTRSPPADISPKPMSPWLDPPEPRKLPATADSEAGAAERVPPPQARQVWPRIFPGL